MSDFGLLIVGFVAKPATQSKADFDAAYKGIYGNTIGSDPDGSVPASTRIGQEITILTDSESGAWEREGIIYAAYDSNQAVSPQLDTLCALTGTTRKPASFSSLLEACFGVAGTVLPAGQVLTVTTTGTRFVSQAPSATLATISAAWVALTHYSLGALIVNNSSVWMCSTAGTSSAASPPTGTGYVTEGSVTWYRVCASTLAAAVVTYQPEVVGPVAAAKLTLVNIATPITGWTGAVNPLDAALGQALETDPALRTRRVLELAGTQGGPPDSIRAAILAIPTVVDCKVFVNNTDVAVDGIPPHAVEVLILAPTTGATSDANLGLAVWRAVGGGIATHGGTTVTVKDASGNDQAVSFTRPAPVAIYVSTYVRFDPLIWTSATAATDVQNAVTAALLNFGLGYHIGEQVRSSPIAGAIEDGAYAVDLTIAPPYAVLPAPPGSPSIPGIVEVRNGANTDGTLPYIDRAIAPVTSTTVAISKREIATFVYTNFTITATSETP